VRVVAQNEHEVSLIGAGVLLHFHVVSVWRLDAQQMMDEEILQQSLTKSASRSMPASGNEKQVELFVGLDECVHDLQR